MDFDLPGLEGDNKDDSELTSVTTSLPTTMASSSTVTMSQTTTPVHVTAVSRTKVVHPSVSFFEVLVTNRDKTLSALKVLK